MAMQSAGSTISISASTTSARTALAGHPGRCWVVNIGSVCTFVRSGDSSVVATAADVPIPPNTGVMLLVPPSNTNMAALTASGTATVYVCPVVERD